MCHLCNLLAMETFSIDKNKIEFMTQNIGNETVSPTPPPPKKRVKFFAISRGSVIVIGVFKTGAKQKFGEIVFIFGEI